MGRLLFVGLDTGGTWKPMLGLAAMLVRRGHSVTVLGSPSMRATTLGAGCSFLALPVDLDEQPGTALEDDHFQSWFEKVCGWTVAAALSPAVEASSADVLVIDFLQFNALSAAELIDRPVASVVHFGMTDWGEGEGWEDQVDSLNATRARLGIDALPRVGGMATLSTPSACWTAGAGWSGPSRVPTWRSRRPFGRCWPTTPTAARQNGSGQLFAGSAPDVAQSIDSNNS